jgi:hypothetical protein
MYLCVTYAECRIVLIVVLMLMSAMDPCMISWNLGSSLVTSWVGFVEVGFTRLWVDHGENP